MANYKDIVGTAVRNNAGNLPAAETGQVWFDSTNIDFKYLDVDVNKFEPKIALDGGLDGISEIRKVS